jgi:hypothetical protein
MPDAQRFSFTSMSTGLGSQDLVPLLPITLTHQSISVDCDGLLDTGSSVNVLPYHIGLALGAAWDGPKKISFKLGGNMAGYEARPLFIMGTLGQFPPVLLAFAWTQADHVPLILGRMNFFTEFDICFYSSQQFFEVRPKV